ADCLKTHLGRMHSHVQTSRAPAIQRAHISTQEAAPGEDAPETAPARRRSNADTMSASFHIGAEEPSGSAAAPAPGLAPACPGLADLAARPGPAGRLAVHAPAAGVVVRSAVAGWP